MNLSIVIVNWNTRERLAGCLESIRADPPESGCEVIVVDNASSDGSAEMVGERFPEVILIENAENLGYAKGNNQAIERSGGKYILLLNPDTELRSGALDVLIRFARNHPDVAAVGCRLVGQDGTVQKSCRSFPRPLPILFEYLRLSRLGGVFGAYRMTHFDYAHEAEVDQPMGSCLLISRKALDDIGKFDEDFPIFFNEVDWCYRAKQKGWKVYFTPEAEIVHYGAASTKQVRAEMVKESHKSLRKFYDKHYKGEIPAPVYGIMTAAIAVNGAVSSWLKSLRRDR